MMFGTTNIKLYVICFCNKLYSNYFANLFTSYIPNTALKQNSVSLAHDLLQTYNLATKLKQTNSVALVRE